MKKSSQRLVVQWLFLFVIISTNGQNTLTVESNVLEEFSSIQTGQERLAYFLSAERKYQHNSLNEWLNVVDNHLKLTKDTENTIEIRTNLLIKAHLNYDSGFYDRSVFITEKLHKNIDAYNTEIKKGLLNLLDLSYAKLGLYKKQIAIREEKRDLGITNTISFNDIYASLGYYKHAYNACMTNEKSSIDETDFYAQAQFYSNTGNLLRLDKTYPSALDHLEKALGYTNLYLNDSKGIRSTTEIIKTKRIQGSIKANIGKCYSEQNDYTKAAIYLEEAIVLLEENMTEEISSELIESKIALANCYLLEGDYKNVARYLSKENVPLTADNKIRYNLLNATYHSIMGNTKKSVLYFERNQRMTDSLNTFNKKIHLQQLNALVGAEKENSKLMMYQQKQVLNQQKADLANKNSRINKDSIFMLVLLLAFAGLFWAYWKSVKGERLITEQKHYIQQALIEKDSMLKEIHHRVKNNLQIVSSLLRQQAKGTNNQEVVYALEEGRIRVKAMALLHQQLYQHDDISVIDMQGYIESLINSVQSIYKSERNNVNITIDAKDVELDLDRAIPFGLMLNELVSNSYKYAFSESEDDGEINIHLSNTPDKGGYFEYADNGIGMPTNSEDIIENSMGIRLIKRLANQLKSTLNVDNSSDGVRFHFSFS